MIAVGRLVLTPQHTLHLVCIPGREVLVATHPQGCSVVTTVTERAMGAGSLRKALLLTLALHAATPMMAAQSAGQNRAIYN